MRILNLSALAPPARDQCRMIFKKFSFHFAKDFHFPITKKKKRGAAGAESRGAAGADEKSTFFYIFLSGHLFSKNNLAKFWKFWEFLRFF